MKSYEYTLPTFQGPLDLLLHLIEKDKIDIYDIPIATITSQFIAYLEEWDSLDIEYGCEFLVMAATLLQIKSKMLLPVLVDEEENDPRDELVNQLVEWQQIKAVTNLISQKYEEALLSVSRPEEKSVLDLDSAYSLDLKALYQLFCKVFEEEKEEKEPSVHIEKEEVTIEETRELLFHRFRKHRSLSFRRLLYEERNKEKRVIMLLTILELLRNQLITLVDTGDDLCLLKTGEVDDR